MSIADLGSTDIKIKSIKTDGISFGNESSALSTCLLTTNISTLTGPFFPVPTVNVYIRKYSGFVIFSASQTQNVVSSNVPITFGTILTPAPYEVMVFPIFVIDQGVTIPGSCRIDMSGTVTVFKGFNEPFTVAGLAGFISFTVCYSTSQIN